MQMKPKSYRKSLYDIFKIPVRSLVEILVLYKINQIAIVNTRDAMLTSDSDDLDSAESEISVPIRLYILLSNVYC